MMRRIAMLAAMALIALAGCENNDIGTECTGMDVPVPSGASTEGDIMRAQGSEIVEYNTAFPCLSTVCVATLGRGAYCSRECRADAGCPKPFTCRTIMDIGPFAGQKFCAWRECGSNNDCGDDDFMCAKVDELSMGENVALCGWR